MQKACRIANAVTRGDMHKLTCRQAVRNSKRCQLPQENSFASWNLDFPLYRQFANQHLRSETGGQLASLLLYNYIPILPLLKSVWVRFARSLLVLLYVSARLFTHAASTATVYREQLRAGKTLIVTITVLILEPITAAENTRIPSQRRRLTLWR